MGKKFVEGSCAGKVGLGHDLDFCVEWIGMAGEGKYFGNVSESFRSGTDRELASEMWETVCVICEGGNKSGVCKSYFPGDCKLPENYWGGVYSDGKDSF